jgi:hypothetical protein
MITIAPIDEEKLTNIKIKLLFGNFLKISTFVFIFLSLLNIVNFSNFLDYSILSVLQSLILRTIDPLFMQLLRGHPDSLIPSIRLIIPLTMILTIGTIFEIISIISNLSLSTLVIGALSLGARGLSLFVLVPVTRSLLAASEAGETRLLEQGGQDDDRVIVRDPPAFVPFQGEGNSMK